MPSYCAECEERQVKSAQSHRVDVEIQGEALAEQVLLQNFKFEPTGYVPLSAEQSGIQKIYRDNNNKIVIVETRSVSEYAPSTLKNTQHGRQMTERWIRKHAQLLVKSHVAANRALANEIVHSLNYERGKSIRRIIINVDVKRHMVSCYESIGWTNNTWMSIEP
jgi:hypothetical protein